MKDMIAKQSGGRVTNKQVSQPSGQQAGQQAGRQGQQQQQNGRQARKKQSTQDRAMQSVDQIMKGDSTVGQAIGSFR